MHYINAETGRRIETEADTEVNSLGATPRLEKNIDSTWESYGFSTTRPVRSIETGKIISF